MKTISPFEAQLQEYIIYKYIDCSKLILICLIYKINCKTFMKEYFLAQATAIFV